MLNCAAVIKYHLLELQKVLNLHNFFFLFSSLVFSSPSQNYLILFPPHRGGGILNIIHAWSGEKPQKVTAAPTVNYSIANEVKYNYFLSSSTIYQHYFIISILINNTSTAHFWKNPAFEKTQDFSRFNPFQPAKIGFFQKNEFFDNPDSQVYWT